MAGDDEDEASSSAWSPHLDKSSGCVFWTNEDTGESTWELPKGVKSSFWVQVTDEASGKDFWYNVNTRESKWTNPNDVAGDSADAENKVKGLKRNSMRTISEEEIAAAKEAAAAITGDLGQDREDTGIKTVVRNSSSGERGAGRHRRSSIDTQSSMASGSGRLRRRTSDESTAKEEDEFPDMSPDSARRRRKTHTASEHSLLGRPGSFRRRTASGLNSGANSPETSKDEKKKPSPLNPSRESKATSDTLRARKSRDRTSSVDSSGLVWEKIFDEETGKHYYFDPESGKSFWTIHRRVNKSGEFVAPSAAAPAKEESPWREILDEKSGKYYYFNENTKKSTWTRPPELGDASPEGVAAASTGGTRARAASRTRRKHKNKVAERFLSALRSKTDKPKQKRPSLAMFNKHYYSDQGIGMGVTGLAQKLSFAANSTRDNIQFEAEIKKLDAAVIANGPNNIPPILDKISDLQVEDEFIEVRKVYDKAVKMEHIKCAEIIGAHLGIDTALSRRKSIDMTHSKRASAREEEMTVAFRLQKCLESDGEDLEELMRAVHAGDALCKKFKISNLGSIVLGPLRDARALLKNHLRDGKHRAPSMVSKTSSSESEETILCEGAGDECANGHYSVKGSKMGAPAYENADSYRIARGMLKESLIPANGKPGIYWTVTAPGETAPIYGRAAVTMEPPVGEWISLGANEGSAAPHVFKAIGGVKVGEDHEGGDDMDDFDQWKRELIAESEGADPGEAAAAAPLAAPMRTQTI